VRFSATTTCFYRLCISLIGIALSLLRTKAGKPSFFLPSSPQFLESKSRNEGTMRRAASFRTTSSHRHIFYGSKLTSFQTTNSSSHTPSIICTQSRYASGKASEFSNQLPTLHEENYHKLDARRKKLLYRSKERGMLETDLLLGTFALKHLHTLNETQLQQYEALLDAIDPDLYQVNSFAYLSQTLIY